MLLLLVGPIVFAVGAPDTTVTAASSDTNAILANIFRRRLTLT